MSAGTQSVLDQMTASVVERKVAAGAKLTPVALEPGALPRTSAAFPNDHPDEALLQRVSALEELFDRMAKIDEEQERLRQLIHQGYAAIRETMDAVKAQLGQTPATMEPVVDAQKAKEQAGDARAKARKAVVDDTEDEDPDAGAASPAVVAAMVKATGPIIPPKAGQEPSGVAVALAEEMDEDESEVVNGWACPQHGKFITKTSRLGREYRACPECTQFEKL